MVLALTDWVAPDPGPYERALESLFARTTAGMKFGLERTLALLASLGNPQEGMPAIHVAGTNGKGSSIATAEALLRAKGLRVGTYTSPHLVDFRERIQVDRHAIPANEVLDWTERHGPLIESLGATFFEATTAMAFDWVRRQEPDVVLVETGLGGRLDATNVVSPLAAGVTAIGFDHMQYLGNTLEQIAFEKAGIFKAGRPAIVGGADERIAMVLARHARDRGADPVWVAVRDGAPESVVVDEAGTHFTLRESSGVPRRLTTPLVGEHQAWNVAFSIAMLRYAGARFAVSVEEAANALPGVRLPGRFQRVGRYIFDVAHNADGAEVLARTIRLVSPPRPLIVLLSVLGDKNWREMIQALAPVIDALVLTVAPTSPASRMWNLNEAVAFARAHRMRAEAVPDFNAALARAGADAATVLVTGSFHTVGDAMARLQLSPLPQ